MSTRRGVRVWRLERDVTHSFVIARRELALGRRARAIGGDECVRSSRRRLSRAARATGWTRADDGGDRDRERRRASSSRGRASDAVETAIERAGGGGECVVVGAENHETDERDERVDAD